MHGAPTQEQRPSGQERRPSGQECHSLARNGAPWPGTVPLPKNSACQVNSPLSPGTALPGQKQPLRLASDGAPLASGGAPLAMHGAPLATYGTPIQEQRPSGQK